MSAAALEVQLYPIWFKTVVRLRVGQVFDLKEKEDFSGALLKPNAVALRSKRHSKGNPVVVHFYGNFA